jgi:hypothetical protein
MRRPAMRDYTDEERTALWKSIQRTIEGHRHDEVIRALILLACFHSFAPHRTVQDVEFHIHNKVDDAIRKMSAPSHALIH